MSVHMRKVDERINWAVIKVSNKDHLHCPLCYREIEPTDGYYSKEDNYQCEICQVELHLMLISFKERDEHYAALIMET